MKHHVLRTFASYGALDQYQMIQMEDEISRYEGAARKLHKVDECQWLMVMNDLVVCASVQDMRFERIDFHAGIDDLVRNDILTRTAHGSKLTRVV